MDWVVVQYAPVEATAFGSNPQFLPGSAAKVTLVLEAESKEQAISAGGKEPGFYDAFVMPISEPVEYRLTPVK